MQTTVESPTESSEEQLQNYNTEQQARKLFTAAHFQVLGLMLFTITICVALVYSILQQKIVTDFTLFTPLLLTGFGITIGGSDCSHVNDNNLSLSQKTDNNVAAKSGGGASKNAKESSVDSASKYNEKTARKSFRDDDVSGNKDSGKVIESTYDHCGGLLTNKNKDVNTEGGHNDSGDVSLGNSHSTPQVQSAITSDAASPENKNAHDTNEVQLVANSKSNASLAGLNRTITAELKYFDDLVENKQLTCATASLKKLICFAETHSNQGSVSENSLRQCSDVFWRAARLSYLEAEHLKDKAERIVRSVYPFMSICKKFAYLVIYFIHIEIAQKKFSSGMDHVKKVTKSCAELSLTSYVYMINIL